MKDGSGERGDITKRLAKALSLPIRRRILGHFMREETPLSPTQLRRALGDLSLSALVYHFNILLDLGIITLVSRRQYLGATEHFSDLEDDVARLPLSMFMVQGSEGIRDD